MVLKNNSKKGLASIAVLKVGLFEIGFVVVVIVIILGVLNYLNIISLSQLYPDKLGFLPRKSISNVSNVGNNPVKQKTFSCPAPIYPCTGKKVYFNNKYLGLGFEVPYQGTIFAAIDGQLSFDEDATQSAVNVLATVENKSKGYKADYNFLGAKLTNLGKEIMSGQVLGTVTAGSMLKDPQYRGINFIFNFQDSLGNPIPFTPDSQ